MNEIVDDTYSSTLAAGSVRIFLTLAVNRDWIIKFTDESTSFLHAGVVGNPYLFPPDKNWATRIKFGN